MSLDTWIGIAFTVAVALVQMTNGHLWALAQWQRLVSRRRTNRLEFLRNERAFYMRLNRSMTYQNVYIGLSVLWICVMLSTSVIFGSMVASFIPKMTNPYLWFVAFMVYLFSLYRIGVHRRATEPRLFERTIAKIDEEIRRLDIGP